jgi:hypothetical protein
MQSVTKIAMWFRKESVRVVSHVAFEGWTSASCCARISVTMTRVPAGYSLADPLIASTSPADPDETNLILSDAARGDQAALRSLLERHRERLRRMVALRLDPRVAARVDVSDVVRRR